MMNTNVNLEAAWRAGLLGTCFALFAAGLIIAPRAPDREARAREAYASRGLRPLDDLPCRDARLPLSQSREGMARAREAFL